MRKKWTRLLAAVLIVPFTLIGCADKEAMQQYYAVETQRTNAIIDSIEIQQTNNAHNRTLQMQTFSSAATSAAATESPVDDALLAFAWGYQMGQPMNIEIPKLTPIKAPDSSADLVRAWTPLIGMAMPFLYPLAYGWASGSGGTKYSTGDGGTIAVQSGNAGSYNASQGDMSTVIDNTGNLGINNSQDNCAGEDCEDPGGIGVEGGTCETDPDGLACEGCSCKSELEGICSCPELY